MGKLCAFMERSSQYISKDTSGYKREKKHLFVFACMHKVCKDKPETNNCELSSTF